MMLEDLEYGDKVKVATSSVEYDLVVCSKPGFNTRDSRNKSVILVDDEGFDPSKDKEDFLYSMAFNNDLDKYKIIADQKIILGPNGSWERIVTDISYR